MCKSLFVCIFLFGFIYACKNEKKIELENIIPEIVGSIITLPIDAEIINCDNFYVSKIQTDSSFIRLFCVEEDTITKLWCKKYKLTSTGIDSTANHPISSIEWAYIDPDTITEETIIDNTPFILFSSQEGYIGAANIEYTVYFYALNMTNLKCYSLSITGRYSFKCNCIDGEITYDKNLEKQIEIKQKLIEFSKKSKRIYQRTKRDEDIYYHMNFEEKWNRDNETENVYSMGYSDINDPTWSTYYKTNLFKLLGDRFSNDFIENEKYKVGNYFRGDIIGYDKNADLYFPIFVEGCAMGCNKNIELDKDNNLIISYELQEDSKYKISLDSIIFDNKQGD